jgi:hypothetical protein
MSDTGAAASVLTGGCLCGGVRYRVTGSPLWAGNCHCTLCRRSGGGPYQSWFAVASSSFALTRGELAHYASSDRARRGFCSTCGSPLVFLPGSRPERMAVNIASLDTPHAVVPTEHIFWDDRVPSLLDLESLPKRAQRT